MGSKISFNMLVCIVPKKQDALNSRNKNGLFGKQIHFIYSKKTPATAVNVDVVMHAKAKNDDELTQMESILHSH